MKPGEQSKLIEQYRCGPVQLAGTNNPFLLLIKKK
jgi:hypothetical protein